MNSFFLCKQENLHSVRVEAWLENNRDNSNSIAMLSYDRLKNEKPKSDLRRRMISILTVMNY